MRRHPFDAHGLVWGVLALGAAGWWLLDRTTTLDASLALVLPIALIVAGLLGVVASFLRRDRGESPVAAPADAAIGEPEPTVVLDEDAEPTTSFPTTDTDTDRELR